MIEKRIILADGNGGKRTRRIIESIFDFGESLDSDLDAAIIQPSLTSGKLAFTTDGFTVQPLEFPGGNIGSLSVYGTVNDLAVAGARPTHLTCAVIIEEGLEFATLSRIAASMKHAAATAGVKVVAGDTKVVPQGHGGGIYITTTGVGYLQRETLGVPLIQAGDQLICSGPIGDHGVAVLLAREDFGLRGDLKSDCGSILPFAERAWQVEGLRFLRDPTRGGLATVAHEVAAATGWGVELYENAIPIRDSVKELCHMLGFDPLYLACEGRIIAITSSESAEILLTQWQALEGGESASILGKITSAPDPLSKVKLITEWGGQRILPELEDDPLPRIC